MTITEQDITSLQAKLTSLELSEGERLALAAMLGDDGAEVAGFVDSGADQRFPTYVPIEARGAVAKARLGVVVWCREFN